ncbi:DUF3304 domain-containing protein [Zymobacter palmae]|uniref:DUF3304 domain-containing protein n=1 Tax=Zymobacter palmae TaxID=33074 RepID=UPI001E56CDEB|nr:DUF3304 domain-containing protein [Zymobacter palmae]
MTFKCEFAAFIAISIIASASMLLTGCSERTTTASVTGINYTDKNIASFQVIQPNNFKNRSPAQEAMAYGAGGQMCCYLLPYEWHEGLKVSLEVEPDIIPVEGQSTQDEYDRRRDTGTLYYNVEVPVSQYAPGKAQLLWIQFLPNQQYRAIATDFDPTNPEFPSDVKGWPVPSVAFRHKLWEREMDDERDTIMRFRNKVFKERSENEWKESWDSYSKYTKLRDKEEDGFKGYDDYAFRQYRKNRDEEIYNHSLKRLEELNKIEPK